VLFALADGFVTFLAGMEGSSSGQDVMWSVFSFLIWVVQESWSPTPYAFLCWRSIHFHEEMPPCFMGVFMTM
jgi:hypothetical protein